MPPDVRFKAKMHTIPSCLGCAPDADGEAYSAPPDSLAVYKGATSKGRAGNREERGRGGKENGKGKGRGRE